MPGRNHSPASRTALPGKAGQLHLRKMAIATLAACFATSGVAIAQPVQLDLIIQSDRIYDGEHDEPLSGELGIAGDRIVYVGKADRARFTALRVIDARGAIVAPGFIDAHTHADRDMFTDDIKKRQVDYFLTQGVTTAVIGNDGGGSYEVAQQAAWLSRHGIGPNAAMYVGFGPIRRSQLGEADQQPDQKQLEAMKALVAKGMCEGAIGFSTGLFYAPQNFASTGEVIALAKVAAQYGGIYDSHIRDEASYNVGLAESIQEVIRIAREAGIAANVAHIKALGKSVEGQSGAIIRMIEAARAQGLRITADHYPWLASSTRLSAALIPPWALDGGRPAMLRRFDDPAQQQRLHRDIGENLRLRNGAGAILFSQGNPKYVGKTLEQLAQERNTDPVSAAIEVLRDSEIVIASFNQSNKDVVAFMKRPWVMTSSDSFHGHPRTVASFAEKYHEYVLNQHTITLAQFIRSSTSYPADALGIARRGRLQPGHFADVVVFDPVAYAPRATYVNNEERSVGVVATVVNGELVVDEGRLTNAMPGRPLLRTPKQGACPQT